MLDVGRDDTESPGLALQLVTQPSGTTLCHITGERDTTLPAVPILKREDASRSLGRRHDAC